MPAIHQALFLLAIGLVTTVTASCSKTCENKCCSGIGDYCCPGNEENKCQATQLTPECFKIEPRPTKFRAVMTEMLWAMDIAKITDEGMVNPLIEYCLNVWKEITPDSKDTQDMLLKWSEMYHDDLNRTPEEYYDVLVETYPNVYAVVKFPMGVFGACFDTFVSLQQKYEIFRKELKEEIKSGSVDKQPSKGKDKETEGELGQEETIDSKTEL